MSLLFRVKNNLLTIDEDCHLAVLNNLEKGSTIYNRSLSNIKNIIKRDFDNLSCEYDDIDIMVELNLIQSEYNKN